ncbi:MAG: hypothetical protein WBN22_02130 [Verrucomicrobiia bacterium]
MKTQVANRSDDAAPFFACSLEAQLDEDKNNGNRNFPPALNLQTRPISVPAGWGPARYPDSGLPSSLKNWLASRNARVIG